MNITNAGLLTSAVAIIGNLAGSDGSSVTIDDATWNNSAGITVGPATPSTLTVTNNAQLNVGTQPTVGPTGTLDLTGGHITAQTITNNTGGTFNFTDGTLTTETFNGHLTQNGGTLAPGASPGTTTINGSYTLNAGTLQIEIDDPITGPTTNPDPGADHDQVNVTGNVTLGGTLAVDLIHSSEDTILPFDTFQVITWGARPGATEFDTINLELPAAHPALFYDVKYNPNDLTIEATALGGDANLDGTVDLTDLTILAINFETPFESRRWRKADFNNDGLTNLTDLTILAINFGSSVSSGSILPGPGADITTLAAAVGLNLNQVPEPATLSLLTLLGAGLMQRRWAHLRS